MRSQNKTQPRRMPLYKGVFRNEVRSWPFFAKNFFFLSSCFLAILYKESISNDFKGLWCIDEEIPAKLFGFQNLFVFLQQVSPICR